MTTFQDSLFDTDFFLGELPEGNYQQFVERKLPTDRRRHFSDLFGEIQKEYNKALASFATQNRGVSPTTQPNLRTFSNFLENFDFEDKYLSTPQEERQGFSARQQPRFAFQYRT